RHPIVLEVAQQCRLYSVQHLDLDGRVQYPVVLQPGQQVRVVCCRRKWHARLDDLFAERDVTIVQLLPTGEGHVLVLPVDTLDQPDLAALGQQFRQIVGRAVEVGLDRQADVAVPGRQVMEDRQDVVDETRTLHAQDDVRPELGPGVEQPCRVRPGRVT